MSSESYRLLHFDEVSRYINEPWYSSEVKVFVSEGIAIYAVPEKYLLKELDVKNFYLSKLQELINDFDFERVQSVMETLNWHWASIEGIPDKSVMISLVRELYHDIEDRILSHEHAYVATGGFKLTFNPDEDDELNLTFEAESCSVYGN